MKQLINLIDPKVRIDCLTECITNFQEFGNAIIEHKGLSKNHDLKNFNHLIIQDSEIVRILGGRQFPKSRADSSFIYG